MIKNFNMLFSHEMPLCQQITILENLYRALDGQCRESIEMLEQCSIKLSELKELERVQDDLIEKNQSLKLDFSDEYDMPTRSLFDIVRGWFK